MSSLSVYGHSRSGKTRKEEWRKHVGKNSRRNLTAGRKPLCAIHTFRDVCISSLGVKELPESPQILGYLSIAVSISNTGRSRNIMEEQGTSEQRKSALDRIKEQRAALKNFYKLKEENEKEDKQAESDGEFGGSKIPLIHKNSSSFSIGGIDPSSIDDMEDFIANESYMNILKVENRVLDKLNSAKSEIKSTIYNNYYELIKINNVLGDLLRPNDSEVYSDTITDNLNTIRDNMQKIKSLDIDIFGDLEDQQARKNNETAK